MNVNMQKWVEALRSGEYEQGEGALKRHGQYCCLGVACDLYAKEKGLQWESGPHSDNFLGSSLFLPKEVQEWLEVSSNSPLILANLIDEETTAALKKWLEERGAKHDSTFVGLTCLNDAKTPFTKIAELIEKNWSEQ